MYRSKKKLIVKSGQVRGKSFQWGNRWAICGWKFFHPDFSPFCLSIGGLPPQTPLWLLLVVPWGGEWSFPLGTCSVGGGLAWRHASQRPLSSRKEKKLLIESLWSPLSECEAPLNLFGPWLLTDGLKFRWVSVGPCANSLFCCRKFFRSKVLIFSGGSFLIFSPVFSELFWELGPELEGSPSKTNCVGELPGWSFQ